MRVMTMPKLKTHRGAAKRMRRTKSGRIKVRKAYRNHILSKHTTKRKRHARSGLLLKKCDQKMVDRLLDGC